MAPIVLGDELLLDCRALRLGDQMAHMECRVTKKGAEDKLMALAVQTRYVPDRLPAVIQRQVDMIKKEEEEREKKK